MFCRRQGVGLKEDSREGRFDVSRCSFGESIKPLADKLPTIVVHLLRDTPAAAAGVRKELLVATRHLLTSEFRTAFVPQVRSRVRWPATPLFHQYLAFLARSRR